MPFRSFVLRLWRRRRQASVVKGIVTGLTDPAHVGTLAQQLDKGQEVLAIQSPLVELLRRSIRGEDNPHAALEETLKELTEEHRVGHVRHLHLVEAEHRAAQGDCAGHD